MISIITATFNSAKTLKIRFNLFCVKLIKILNILLLMVDQQMKLLI